METRTITSAADAPHHLQKAAKVALAVGASRHALVAALSAYYDEAIDTAEA